MAFTSPDGLPYPDDYADPADTPAVVEALAIATQVALDKKVPSTRNVVAGNGLTGGGDLTADRPINVVAGAGITVTADAVAVDQTVMATRAYADSKVTNVMGTGTTVAPSQNAVTNAVNQKAQVYIQTSAPSSPRVGDIWATP